MKPTLPITFLASAGIALSALAQFEPYPSEEYEDTLREVSVTFYSDPGFRGDSITLPANAFLEDLDDVRFDSGRRANNRISSIWIEGHAHVTLYDYGEFRGDSVTIMESEADLDLLRQGRLGDWDNDISSISVSVHEEEVVCAPGPTGPIGHIPPRVVTYPTHPGPSTPYPVGPSHGPSHGPDFHPYDHHFRMDPAVIRKIDRAYQDVLRRRPDDAGRKTYYWTMIERNWSESRLRKELRKSDEYHQQTIPTVVNKVYKEVLGREPDPAGFKFYTEKMSRDGWYESKLRDALKSSPEYRSRGRTPIKPPTVNPPRDFSVPKLATRPVEIARKPTQPTTRVNIPRSPVVTIPKATKTFPTVAPRPADTPRPTRVVTPPSPRPVAPKVATRKSSANPPKMKPSPPQRTRPAPPNLN